MTIEWSSHVRSHAKRMSILLCAVLLAGTMTACGSADEPQAPTAVTKADLDKSGEFWLSLTPDLKDELIIMGKARLGEQRPDGAAQIAAVPADKLIAEIEKTYTNESKRDETVFFTYAEANDALARAQLNDALGQMDQLCSGMNPPPQCP
jgi:hypothetical protein